jgi:hypothetical protein
MKSTELFKMACRSGVFIFLFLLQYSTFGQYALGGLDLDENADAWYDEQVGNSGKGLFEGVYYHLDQPAITTKSHIYFSESSWQSGYITFREQSYQNIHLAYDIVNDVLVVQNEAVFPAQPIKLNQNQIASFGWDDLYFQRMDAHHKPPMGPGFYQWLYRGAQLSCTVKRRKISQIVDTKAEYVSDSRYFILIENRYHHLINRRSFYKVFPDLKKDIRQYIKVNNLRPGSENDKDILLVLAFCDQKLGDEK